MLNEVINLGGIMLWAMQHQEETNENFREQIGNLQEEINQLARDKIFLENKASDLEAKLDDVQTEIKRNNYIRIMNENDALWNKVVFASCIVPPLFPVTLFLKYNKPLHDQASHFEALEKKYLEENLGCLKSEAYNFARQKMHQLHVQYEAEQAKIEESIQDAYSG
jgi:hypothetical protein